MRGWAGQRVGSHLLGIILPEVITSLFAFPLIIKVKKKKKKAHNCNYATVSAVAVSPKALARLCESAHPWLPALRATGGTGNFSNVHKDVEREF